MAEEKDLTYFSLVHFEGHVQGVGFRYSTLQIAKGYEVTGYVKNLTDGRVEMLSEGEQEECQSFIENVKEELESFIRRVEMRDGQQPRQSSAFVIA